MKNVYYISLLIFGSCAFLFGTDVPASLTVKVMTIEGLLIDGAMVNVQTWEQQRGSNPYTSACGSYRLKTNSNGTVYIDDWKLTCSGKNGKAVINDAFPTIIIQIKASAPGLGEREVTDFLTLDEPNGITTIYLGGPQYQPPTQNFNRTVTIDFSIKVADQSGNPVAGARIEINPMGEYGGPWFGAESFGHYPEEMMSEGSFIWVPLNVNTGEWVGTTSSPDWDTQEWLRDNTIEVANNAAFWIVLPVSSGQEISVRAIKSGYRSTIDTKRITTAMMVDDEVRLYMNVTLYR